MGPNAAGLTLKGCKGSEEETTAPRSLPAEQADPLSFTHGKIDSIEQHVGAIVQADFVEFQEGHSGYLNGLKDLEIEQTCYFTCNASFSRLLRVSVTRDKPLKVDALQFVPWR